MQIGNPAELEFKVVFWKMLVEEKLHDTTSSWICRKM